jgi:methylated-DNA-protein-cysteine methyltransferase related protein
VSDTLARIRRVIAKIPRGRVMTYGAVAAAAGMPRAARTVGYAMRALGRTVPWQRVLGLKNPRTAHVTIVEPHAKAEQRRLLEKEGVRFDARGGVSLREYGWVPGAKRASPAAGKLPKTSSARRA